MIDVVATNSPEEILNLRKEGLSHDIGEMDCFAVIFNFQQYFLEGSPGIDLFAIYQLKRIGKSLDGIEVVVGVTDRVSAAKRLLAKEDISIFELVEQLRFPLLNLSLPVKLKTVAIAKPWGQEIWYTGMEARGQSSVVEGENQTPLSWWLAVAANQLAAGKERSINLLKILDPLPEEVYGDLYFELHEEKREVYVVTHVDPVAWPSGKGQIRFGFDQNVLRQYEDEESFRSAYLESVNRYEAVRRQIDTIYDQCRERQSIALDAPVSAEQLKRWHSELPVELQSQEQQLRAEMNHFTAVKELQVGDVVKVPCLTPHALQHGVRTVEFQTPVYERKILSFAQKVLTQSHWDTQEAAELMALDKPLTEPLSVVESSQEHELELVVSFDDFQVFRLTLKERGHWQLPVTDDYALLMSIEGRVVCGDTQLSEEESVFIPAKRSSLSVTNSSTTNKAIILLAQPC